MAHNGAAEAGSSKLATSSSDRAGEKSKSWGKPNGTGIAAVSPPAVETCMRAEVWEEPSVK
jgi:hypothetical protein